MKPRRHAEGLKKGSASCSLDPMKSDEEGIGSMLIHLQEEDVPMTDRRLYGAGRPLEALFT